MRFLVASFKNRAKHSVFYYTSLRVWSPGWGNLVSPFGHGSYVQSYHPFLRYRLSRSPKEWACDSLHWIFDFNTAAWLGYAIAVILLAGSLFIPRLWCRYMCPLGGVIGLIQYLSPIKIRRDANVCIDCGLCNRVCPMRLSVATATSVSGDCIACLECVERCPVKGSLNVSLGQLQPVIPGSKRYETQ